MSAETTQTTYTWDRMDKEPADWFARFERYRLLGPISRTVTATFRLEPGGPKGRPPARWWDMARKWHWQARAEVWDAEERVRVLAKLAEDAEAFRQQLLSIARAGMQETERRVSSLGQDALLDAADIGDTVALWRASVEAMERALVAPQLDVMRERLAALERRMGGEAGV